MATLKTVLHAKTDKKGNKDYRLSAHCKSKTKFDSSTWFSNDSRMNFYTPL